MSNHAELKRNLLTFWLCFTATVARPTTLLRNAIVPVLMAIVSVGMLAVLVYALNIHMEENARPVSRALLGAKVAMSLAQKMTDEPPNEKIEEAKEFSGSTVFIDAPISKRNALEPFLTQAGMKIVSVDKAEVAVHWLGDRWRLSSKVPGDNLLAFPAISEAIEKMNPPKFQHDNFTQVSTSSMDAKDRQKAEKARSFALTELIPTVVIVIIGFVFLMTSVSMSTELDRARSSGYLEAFALTPAPFWTYVLAHCASQAVQYALIIIAIILGVGLFLPPMPLLSLLGVSVGLLFAATANSMLGVLHVFVFHSKWAWARPMGFLLLSPFSIVLAFSMSLAFSLERFMSKSSSTNSAYKSVDQLPFLSLPPANALLFMVVSIVVSSLIIVAACRFLEWRVGPRRHGLSSI